ncbi:MAG: FAD-dependent monooxygenase [Coriobacteriia bacterium]|nr:FAD-dependent monooxygenase [Coriobacteriia bacterium]
MRDVSPTPKSEHYRTIIVGAGPAGILTAYHAAPAGSTLLVEAGLLPRYKSCGGMLHAHTRRTLAEYAPIPDDIILDPRTVLFRFHDWDRKIKKVTSLELLNVDRALFDEWLLGILPPSVEIVAPCEVRSLTQDAEKVSLTLRSGKGDMILTCDNLIGADGGRSKVRRDLGVPNTAQYVTLQDFVHLEGPIEPYFDCIYIRGIGEDYAYTYVVPKGDVADIGCVYYPQSKQPWLMQNEIVRILRAAMPALGETVTRQACTALYVRSVDDVVAGEGRILLAGEAGGFLSPTSGEGISYAVNTGRLAGSAVADNDPIDAVAAYRKASSGIRTNIARKFRWLPMMESRAGKYVAGFVPQPIVSRITHEL